MGRRRLGQLACKYSEASNKSEGYIEITARFHQLHCLAGLRKALQEASEGKDIGMDWTDNLHWPHCLDLLRSVSSGRIIVQSTG